jgi:pimeloyl-ACP methyl ester carboxylesterase
MKNFKKVTHLFFGLLIFLSIGVLGLYVWSRTGTYPARSIAISALESSDKVTVSRDDFLVFDPVDRTRTGLIFYPGGLVEPSAYAPVLHMIAQKGVLVVITPMPFNLAIFNTGAASDVIDEYPDISDWVLTGHSLGGASAAIFAENNPDLIDAIAFWDSYPSNSADLSDNQIRVLSIYGTMNGYPNTDKFDEKRHLVPDNTKFIPIEGANHAHFGDYGPQKDDVNALISINEQHEIVTKIILEFIADLTKSATQ